MITAIVTSDNHLGAYYARLKPERLEHRRRALQKNFERVVDAAIARHADLFLHTGDLFDRPDPRNAERFFVARQVRRLHDVGIPVFAIAGNHDSPRSFGHDGGVLPHEEMDALGAIHLFRNTQELQVESLMIRGQRVGVWGMSSDFNRPVGVCPLDDFIERHERHGEIDVVLLHYGVEGWAQPWAQEPCLSLANLDRLNADAICVGHLHARADKRLPGGALLLNPGATEHIHFGEENLDCGFWVLHLEPGHVQGEYCKLPAQPMRTVELAVPLSSDGSTLMEGLTTELDSLSYPDQLLRTRLVGRLARAEFQELDLAALQARGEETNLHCQLDTEQLVVVDEGIDLPVGYGVSFDAHEELQHTVQAVLAAYGEDEQEQQICRQAGQEIEAVYERLTKGAR